MRIVIACGASGGHIFPGIALAGELKNRDNTNEILILCSERPIDVKILKKSGYNFSAVPSEPVVFDFNPVRALKFTFKLIKGTLFSIRALKKFKPDCMAGFGGFVSGQAVFAAWLLGIPVLIHEQNVVPGLANRIEAFFAKRIAVSFKETGQFFKNKGVVITGNPVRGTFVKLDKALSREELGLDKEGFTLFITGGSQGASFLNNLILETFASMNHEEKSALQVIHIAGNTDYHSISEKYRFFDIRSNVFGFLDEMDKAYAASDLVIARAGATTIAELTYFGKPAILIPYPKKRVHQLENANSISSQGAAITVEESNLDAHKMKMLLFDLLENTKKLDEMSRNSSSLGKPEAACLLREELEKIANAKQ